MSVALFGSIHGVLGEMKLGRVSMFGAEVSIERLACLAVLIKLSLAQQLSNFSSACVGCAGCGALEHDVPSTAPKVPS
jgi:hypothetical protein